MSKSTKPDSSESLNDTAALPSSRQPDGDGMYHLAEELFPIGRSLTGEGVRESLRIIQKHIPLEMHEVPTGASVFDWTVPYEWNVREAYIIDPYGNRLADYSKCNLHLLGYSEPIRKTVSKEELEEHLHSIPEQPDVIPYVISYYEKRWGFCLADQQRQNLPAGNYQVVIDATLEPGALTYGSLYLPGDKQSEILLSASICHPSLANNELSGPVLLTWIAKYLCSRKNRRLSYRIVFVPETIGSLCFVSQNLETLQSRVIAGYVLTCIGDSGPFSYLSSRPGDCLSDHVATQYLEEHYPHFRRYSYLDRGGDERQYGFPGIDLPIGSIMRTKYLEYPEYHTSADNLALLSPSSFQESFEVVCGILKRLEAARIFRVRTKGEPQLGRRGLYPTLSTISSRSVVEDMMNVLAYCDGRHDLTWISKHLDRPIAALGTIIDTLLKHDVIDEM